MSRRVLWMAGNDNPGEATLIVATEKHTRPGDPPNLNVFLDTQTLDVVGLLLDPAEVTGLRDALNEWLTGVAPNPPGGTP